MVASGSEQRSGLPAVVRGRTTVLPGVAHLQSSRGAYEYVARVDLVERHGRAVPEVVELTVRAKPGGAPLSGRRIQDEFVGVRLAAVASLAVRVSDKRQLLFDHAPDVGDVDRMISAGFGRGQRPQVKRTALLQKAAKLYRAAEPGTRTAAVAQGLGVKQGVARKRVMEARSAGLLPPADSTRPRLDSIARPSRGRRPS